jgi:DNA-binding NarL/FixJ family response regulator
MKKEVAAAFVATRLSTLELQILSARKRGFTLEIIAAVLNLTPTSLKRTHLPSINRKLGMVQKGRIFVNSRRDESSPA